VSAWSNYDDVLRQLQAFGLEVQHLQVDTPRPVRCRTRTDRGREKTGWYILHELRTRAGEALLVGAYGDWREGVDANGRPISHRIELSQRALTEEEKAAVRRRVREDRQRAERAREAAARRAARRAEKAWAACGPVSESRYLREKQVGAHGIRQSPSGNLVIPLHDANGKIHGLQVIYDTPEAARRRGRGKDFWPAGLTKRGRFYLIGAPTWLVLVAEGYATAASLHEATGLPVAVAYDAGNLKPVCEALAQRYKDARILVCADDDWLGRCRRCKRLTPVETPACRHCGEAHGKGNTGVAAASSAALAVGGSWVAPVFADRGESEKLTDFNDLHRREGLHVVRAQIEARLQALGWKPKAPVDDGQALVFSLDLLLEDYALIYGTETVFDGVRRRIVHLSALRAAAGKSLVRMWLEHPERRLVMPEQVGFDPTEQDRDILCNLWGGWPTTPKAGSCDRLLELFEYLCAEEDDPPALFDWVMKWLAYPIQHPGAKMQTALLVHGPEGTGKNTAFGCVRRIYGKYGGIFDQTQLESQFNGFMSGKLFMIGNEVVTRVELYHQQGRLKNLITEDEIQINEKNLPTRLEANHCNFVFFSNRLDIAKLDRGDRRYCVIWTPPPLGEDFYREVADEIAAGGTEALHHHLATLPLGDFGPHTKPPMTRAKRDLIEMSVDPTEKFIDDWLAGELPLPATVVPTQELYEAYRTWARKEGLARTASKRVLIGAARKRTDRKRDKARFLRGSQRVFERVVWPIGVVAPQEYGTVESWVTAQVTEFSDALRAWASSD